MITEIAAIASSLKVAGDITKATIDLRDAEAMRSKVIELQTVILTAQGNALSAIAEQSSLMERIQALETRLASAEGWKSTAERYQLHCWETGSFSYRLKDGAQPAEPLHYVCARCFEEHRRSILNTIGRSLKCPACQMVIEVRPRAPLPQPDRQGF